MPGRDRAGPSPLRIDPPGGISMGGLGALLYCARYPGHVTALALLAPFVGEPRIIEEIAAAGGVRSWSPRPMPELELQHELWRWLKQHDPARPECPRIVLGYGLRDSSAPGLGLLADILPEEHVFKARGRHDWRTWRHLWRTMLPTLLPASEGG
jgi:pimeloyl-ACP methyl ester carboxylesterase